MFSISNLKLTLIIIIFPVLLFSQNEGKLERLDTTIDLQQKIIAEFGEEMFNSVKQFSNWKEDLKMAVGIMYLKDVISNQYRNHVGLCMCYKDGSNFQIMQTRTIFGGIQVHFNIDLEDLSSAANLQFFSDDMPTTKLNEEDEFESNFTLPLTDYKIFLSNTKKLKHGQFIQGEFILESPEFYEKGYFNGEVEKRKYQIESVFECKIVDIKILSEELEKEGKN